MLTMSSCGARLRCVAYKFVQPIAATTTTMTTATSCCNTRNYYAAGLRDDLQPANVGAVVAVVAPRAFNTASSAQHPDVLTTKNKATMAAGGGCGVVPAERFPFTEPVRFEQRMKKLTRFVL